jgi:hypothetical protein
MFLLMKRIKMRNNCIWKQGDVSVVLLMKRTAILTLFCCAAFISQCAPLAGTETETQTGTVSAIIYNGTDSTLFANTPVNLHTAEKTDTLKTITSFTNSQGYITLDSVPVGAYFLEIGDSNFAVLRPCTVKVLSTWYDTLYTEPTGSITGNLCLPFIGNIFSIEISLNEINRTMKIDSSGFFSIPFLPAFDDYTFAIKYASSTKTFSFLTDSSFQVNAGATTSLGNIALFTGNAHIYGISGEAITGAHHANLTITAYNLLPMHSSMTIIDTNKVYCPYEGIPEGLDRIFKIDVFDSTGVLLYTGSDTTDITSDKTITLSVLLTRK